MVDPLPLDPLEVAVVAESKESRELWAAFLTAPRFILRSCVACDP